MKLCFGLGKQTDTLTIIQLNYPKVEQYIRPAG